MKNKALLCIGIVVITCFGLYIHAGNLELFEKPPRIHGQDESGEVILKWEKDGEVYDCAHCHNLFFMTLPTVKELIEEHSSRFYRRFFSFAQKRHGEHI